MKLKVPSFDFFGLLRTHFNRLRFPPEKTLSMLRPVESRVPLLRIGGPNDGGYLVPDDLEGIDGVFSPGVAETATFEEYFAKLGIPCWLLDASVDEPPVDHEHIQFEKKWLGAENSSDTVTLEEWVDKNLPDSGDLILQMDIENAEWEILDAVKVETLKKFRIIVIELHFLGNKLLKPHWASRLHSIFSKLTKNHSVVHFHPNNCCGEVAVSGRLVPVVAEVTLVRRDRNIAENRFAILPHPLDSSNTENVALGSPW